MITAICSVCKEQSDNCYKRSTNTYACRTCESKRKVAKISQWKENGQCADCASLRFSTWIYCEKHYVKRKMKQASCKHLWVEWYYEQLKKQDHKCFYTWMNLVIWQNDSIDHMIPRSRWGSSEADNLVICDKMFNLMKLNYTLEEVMLRCKWFIDTHGDLMID